MAGLSMASVKVDDMAAGESKGSAGDDDDSDTEVVQVNDIKKEKTMRKIS